MRRGPTLPLEKQTTLCTEVTDQEIIDSLGCIDKVGKVIHNDVLLAVKEFFHIGKLYRAINCTTTTLTSLLVNLQFYNHVFNAWDKHDG
ncbi:hypothetical protein H5410_044676 [Solanum commersonii]|uniref:Uncharacterized protein n=1 Tax=Solanum commersonii TaxID=4109 RepID=A0A9J5X8S8_SOLCO|nr:hypothetical protein H5410_044676 [Solanum commersonii]